MAPCVYVYVATARTGLTRRVLFFDAPQPLKTLVSGASRPGNPTAVDVTLGRHYFEIRTIVRCLPGVVGMEMLAAEVGDGGNPLNADFHVTRKELRGGWDVIMAGITNLIGRIMGEDYEVHTEYFAYDDGTPPTA